MTDRSQSSEQVRREINATRTGINDTLSALQDRFSAGQLFDQVMGYLRENGGGIAGDLGQVVRKNPVPVGLIGVGLTWLVVSGARDQAGDRRTDPSGTGDRRDRGQSSVSPSSPEARARGADNWQGRFSSAADSVKTGAADVATTVRETADASRRRTEEYARRARRQGERAHVAVGRFVREKPLIVGALALATGAAIGAALPRTRRENDLLGEHSDDAKRATKETIEDGIEKMHEAVDAGLRAVEPKTEPQADKAEPKASTPSSKPSKPSKAAGKTAKDAGKDSAKATPAAAKTDDAEGPEARQ